VRRCSPVEGSVSHSHYSIWLMVEGLGAQHTAAGWQAGRHLDGCASSVYITSRHRAGRRQPTSCQTSGVKSGSGLRGV
jgi:hypothetical protein